MTYDPNLTIGLWLVQSHPLRAHYATARFQACETGERENTGGNMPSPVLPISCKRRKTAGNWPVSRCSGIPSMDLTRAMTIGLCGLFDDEDVRYPKDPHGRALEALPECAERPTRSTQAADEVVEPAIDLRVRDDP